jgi:hypothetical protein
MDLSVYFTKVMAAAEERFLEGNGKKQTEG